MKLHYAGTPGEGYGWGTFGTYMTRELSKLNSDTMWGSANVVLMPLADHDFNPAGPERGELNFAMTFFESQLGPNAAENAKKYDVVFCGSTWCLERMREHGITNGEVLIQGVDTSIFKPMECSLSEAVKDVKTESMQGDFVVRDIASMIDRQKKDQFRIFSGGKFEYRKGQDLVIAAFREFVKRHPHAHLVCSWFNPWPQLVHEFLARFGYEALDEAQDWQFSAYRFLMKANGFTEDQFTILPPLRHADLAREMANTDCGLFPNRCEGGTNLVLMEYAACGKRIVANTMTGHRDVDYMIHHKLPDTYGENGWAEDTIDEINIGLTTAHLAHALKWKNHTPEVPTWEAAAKQILQRAESLLQRL